ncbi:MAG: glycoside hydrolase family 16 protein [Bacteroidales bacterium]|jgi:beta-glucanase (GH16 family)|nr:glycoside hydrolase family 16 protein [Bacteroidales bacterium]
MKIQFLYKISALLLFVNVINLSYSQSPPNDKNWEIDFVDDFNSNTLNSRWYKEIFTGHGKRQDPYLYKAENITIDNGKLLITAKNTANILCTNSVIDCCYGKVHHHTSGSLSSTTTYKYGYFEIVTKLPAGEGFCPAFWLWNFNCPENWYNEIDIMEGIFDASTMNSNNVWINKSNKTCTSIFDSSFLKQFVDTVRNVNITQYNTYAFEWTPRELRWYLNGNLTKTIKNTFSYNTVGIQHPMYLVTNLALEKLESCGNTGRKVTANTPFPAIMYVDKISHYNLKTDCNTIVNEIPNFNTYYYAVKKSITLSGTTNIPPNSNITLRATDYFELKTGFVVPLGTEVCFAPTACY